MGYDGEDVEAIPHICNEIMRRFDEAAQQSKADVVIIELGGTAGEYQNVFYYETARMMRRKNPESTTHIHVVYLPVPASIGELKSKPAQMSVKMLNSMGIQPDFLVCRAERTIDAPRINTLSRNCGLEKDDIIANPDVPSIYEVPLVFEDQGFADKILAKLSITPGKQDMTEWRDFVSRIKKASRTVKIGVVGKYFTTGDYHLEDSYVSVIEAIKHAAWAHDAKPLISWVDSEAIEREGTDALEKFDAIIVPGGFGARGTEGMIQTVRFAREKNKPYLGLCFGLHMAVIEFARNVCGMQGANTTEIDPETNYPVISLLEEQHSRMEKSEYGATMRLGAFPAVLKEGSLVRKEYGRSEISERHRHRYEVNPRFIEQLESKGLVFSGQSPDRKLMEFLELLGHRYFVATQAHPEFKSRPMKPSPLFDGLIRAALS
ncbi:CTP synthetase [Candidatus Woesearchaeota archaeon CG10_big_fil_rev_8_21_14_0_10_47_5]|nr:MAG: CTP synthetase [Candidatus Woesearchaeota archaeon CG10_big_fil_rev_8_21_14_0_10_47_5]